MQSLRSIKGGGQGVLAVIAVVVIGLAAYLIVKQTKPKKDTAFGGTYYYCTKCRKEFADRPDSVPPIKCPSCGEMTAANLRKYRCKQCKTVFRGFIEKFDPETKALIDRRKRGEKVPEEQIKSILISEPEEEDWVDASSEEGIAILNEVTCPNCKATGVDLEPIFPEPEKNK